MLKAAGLLYPGKRSGEQFTAALDARGADERKFADVNFDHAWDRMAAEIRAHDGNVVFSHETLARCSSAAVQRVKESLDGADVQVVLTVRDLGRQIPAVWQETLKNRATNSYEDFLEDIFLNVDSGEHKFFWKPQDVSRVVRRWGRQMGMDHVTIVTVPPSGAPRDELWRRFARAVDLPDVPIDLPSAAANSSLGPAEAELLRHVNASLPDDFPWSRYARVIKRQFAEQRLGIRSSTRIVVPARWHDAVQTRAKDIVGFLEQSGTSVIGDLGDLDPTLPAVDVAGPDDLSRDELMATAAEVLRDYVLRPEKGRTKRGARSDDEEAGVLDGGRALAARVARRLAGG